MIDAYAAMMLNRANLNGLYLYDCGDMSDTGNAIAATLTADLSTDAPEQWKRRKLAGPIDTGAPAAMFKVRRKRFRPLPRRIEQCGSPKRATPERANRPDKLDQLRAAIAATL